ncbi:hypothetical protein Emin_0237 [Elusimicrobium minutum Pei191]|uniref:Uncharacterized protein n=1 Tax=Elusimicrobium minutum (strain Pei191) TaxID=445932 RepID=B2KB40_ELUMP|nr:hypothetical protein [Elusimicrobium minutum]ACC97799.1 hypothetical protein Emin_0237 [Elusimicrobium minutum Pei191]
MKKIIILIVFICVVTAGYAQNYYSTRYHNKYYYEEDVHPYRLSDPFYIQDLGVIVLDTTGWVGRNIHGDKERRYVANQTLTLGLADWFVLGGGISYKKYDTLRNGKNEKIKGFLNPYALAKIRFLDKLFKIDLLGKVTFDAFDTVAEGGIESGTQKYEGELLAGPKFEKLSIGAKAMYGYWRKGTEIINPDKNYQSNVGGGAIVSVRPLSFFDFGGEAGYIVYDVAETKDEKEFYFSLNANFEIIKGIVLLGAFYDFHNLSKNEDYQNLGIRFKVAI